MELYPHNTTLETCKEATDAELAYAVEQASGVVQRNRPTWKGLERVLEVAGNALEAADRVMLERMCKDAQETTERWQSMGLKAENEQRMRADTKAEAQASKWAAYKQAETEAWEDKNEGLALLLREAARKAAGEPEPAEEVKPEADEKNPFDEE